MPHQAAGFVTQHARHRNKTRRTCEVRHFRRTSSHALCGIPESPLSPPTGVSFYKRARQSPAAGHMTCPERNQRRLNLASKTSVVLVTSINILFMHS